MLYTIGRIDIYEPYMKSDPNASKGKTGSVWKTLESIQSYYAAHSSLKNFKIYGVDASWDDDTEVVPGEEWRSLVRPCRLVQISEE